MKMREAMSQDMAFPEPTDIEYLKTTYLKDPEKTIQVQQGLFVYVKGEHHSLVRNGHFLGMVKLSPITIHGVKYQHLDLIYVLPEHRNTGVAKMLLFYVKEHNGSPIAIDGAVSEDGQKLITALGNSSLGNVRILDKTTGEKEKFIGLVNDIDKCYILESTQLGVGKQYFPEPMEFTWYPLFGSFDKEN